MLSTSSGTNITRFYYRWWFNLKWQREAPNSDQITPYLPLIDQITRLWLRKECRPTTRSTGRTGYRNFDAIRRRAATRPLWRIKFLRRNLKILADVTIATSELNKQTSVHSKLLQPVNLLKSRRNRFRFRWADSKPPLTESIYYALTSQTLAFDTPGVATMGVSDLQL